MYILLMSMFLGFSGRGGAWQCSLVELGNACVILISYDDEPPRDHADSKGHAVFPCKCEILV